MAKKVLAIVEADDSGAAQGRGRSGLVAHTRALKRAGADVHLLLRGRAVTYGVRTGEAYGLQPATQAQPQPLLADREVASLIQKSENVYYVEDDARARSIAADQLVKGLTPVRSHDLPALLHGYERIWRW